MSVAKDVLEPRAPASVLSRREDLLERRHDPRRNARPLLGVLREEGIERDRVEPVAGVEEHDVIGAVPRDAFQDCFCQIPVRVDERHARSRANVGFDQLPQERRLPHPGLPHDRQMPAAVIEPDPDLPLVASKPYPPEHRHPLLFL